VIGGVAQVERIAYGDDTLRVLLDLSPACRKEAFGVIARLVDNARLQPPLHLPPSPGRRIKVRWTDDVIARFKSELPRARNDVDLAARLGLPPYCRRGDAGGTIAVRPWGFSGRDRCVARQAAPSAAHAASRGLRRRSGSPPICAGL
jgi:hypothetical protein